MLSTSYAAKSATEPSKRKLISSTTERVPSNIDQNIPHNKCNKLSSDLCDLFSTATSDMSSSIATRSMLTHPASLTCIKAPPIIAAVHCNQKHRNYVLKRPDDQVTQDTEIGERQLSPISVVPLVTSNQSLEASKSSFCTSNRVNVNSIIAPQFPRTIPSNKINLRLILVSGKTKEFLFNPADSAGEISHTVFESWPEDWSLEAVSKSETLRLIYQGRFLHCNVTLGALGLPLGKTTVMHLVPRDNLPEPNSQDQRQKSKGGSGRCCSTSCCIL